jgi:hypothetical protein
MLSTAGIEGSGFDWRQADAAFIYQVREDGRILFVAMIERRGRVYKRI